MPRPALLLLVMLPALVGCAAQRTLKITSEPPGALVRLGDEEVGVTPVEIDFGHYGVRRVTLYLDGHRTHSEVMTIEPPWYGRFPLDFVSEVLLPFGWKDEHRLDVLLVAGRDEVPVPELRSVFERAETLRSAGPAGPRELPPPVSRAEDPPPPDTPQ